jgi:hypothetical protein
MNGIEADATKEMIRRDNGGDRSTRRDKRSTPSTGATAGREDKMNAEKWRGGRTAGTILGRSAARL